MRSLTMPIPPQGDPPPHPLLTGPDRQQTYVTQQYFDEMRERLRVLSEVWYDFRAITDRARRDLNLIGVPPEA